MFGPSLTRRRTKGVVLNQGGPDQPSSLHLERSETRSGFPMGRFPPEIELHVLDMDRPILDLTGRENQELGRLDTRTPESRV